MNSTVLALRIAGTIFGIVSAVHLLRLITHFSLVIGDWSVPLWVNVLGVVIAGALSVWLWRLSCK